MRHFPLHHIKSPGTNLDSDQSVSTMTAPTLAAWCLCVFLATGRCRQQFLFTLIGESMSVGYIDTSAGLRGRRSRWSGSHGRTLLETVAAEPVLQTTGVAPSKRLFSVQSLNGARRTRRCSSDPLKADENTPPSRTKHRPLKTYCFSLLWDSSSSCLISPVTDSRAEFLRSLPGLRVVTVNVVARQPASPPWSISDFSVAEHYNRKTASALR